MKKIILLAAATLFSFIFASCSSNCPLCKKDASSQDSCARP